MTDSTTKTSNRTKTTGRTASDSKKAAGEGAERRATSEQRKLGPARRTGGVVGAAGEKVAEPGSSAGWIAYLRFMSACRRFSFHDLLLVATQRPHATHVAGFRKWQQLDR